MPPCLTQLACVGLGGLLWKCRKLSPVEVGLGKMFGYKPAHGPREVVVWGHVPKCPQFPGPL